jgi:bifunctional DNA-binding transcriptional regulator/antitoxin component of YhaV-PrlF toxin-antitoxin module
VVMIGRVQECGCIALPEAVQERTGLYPGATFDIEVTQEGSVVLLRPLETRQPGEPNPGAHCG